MSEIHGLAVHAAGAHLLPYKFDPGGLKANEVEIKISHCGVCHSDVYLIDNDWGVSKYPFIPGHEIVGVVADAKYEQILGVHIIGPSATDLIAESVAAMELEATVEDLMWTIHAHPTLAEAMMDAVNSVYGLAINA